MELLGTIYRFFFPDDTKIKMEARTDVLLIDKKIVRIRRSFYTFRAVKTFLSDTYFLPIVRQPNFQLATALSLLALFLKDIASIHRVFFITGAIAYDTSASSTSQTTTPTTFSHTVTGSNPTITVAFASYRGASSCTYNSVSMTLGTSAVQGAAHSGVYYLGGCSTGTNNVVFTAPSTGCDHICSISFSGTNTSSVLGVTGTNVATSAMTISQSVTTLAANSFLVDAIATEQDSAHVYAPDVSQTQRMWAALAFWIGGGASTKPTTTTGSYTMSWTKSSGTTALNLSLSIIEIKALTSTAWTQTLSDSATITGSITKTPTKRASEVTIVADTIIRSIVRTISESTTISDVLSAIRVQIATLLESLAVSDTITRTIGKLLTDTATVADNIAKATTRIVSETLSITDTFSRALTVVRTLVENISITDTIKKLLNGMLVMYSDKFSNRGTSYGTKYSSQGTTYKDKYTHLQ